MNAWEQKIVGLLLQDDRKLLDHLRYGVMMTSSDWSDEGGRNLWEAILTAADANLPLLPGVIAQREGWHESDLQEIAGYGFSIGTDEAVTYARRIIENHDRQRIAGRIEAAKQELIQGKPFHEVQQLIATELAQHRGTVIQPSDTSAIYERVTQRRELGILPKVVPTGISWFDVMLGGGIHEKQFIAIGGRQKGRKTSVLRNLMLGAATKHNAVNPDVSIAMMTFENDQEIVYYDLVAMEAARWCYENNFGGRKIKDRPAVGWLSGRIIQNAYEGRRIEHWVDFLKDAVRHAMSVVNQMMIWVYDSQPQNGNLNSLSNLLMAIEMHRQRHTHSNQLLIVAVDYAQLVTNIGKDYEDMKAFSNEMLRVAQSGAAVIALTQFNEASNYERAATKRGERPSDHLGTKGGGSLEAAVHNFYKCNYNPRENKEQLVVEQARARHGEWSEKLFDIHPASGLLLPPPA